jgi:Cu2+-exporting ATPase
MTPSGDACWHCGEPLPATVVSHAQIAGQPRRMCCHGCRAAAEWIEQLGLTDYYRLRTQPARKPDSGADSGRDAWRRPEIARHVIRDLGAGVCETMLLIEGVRCAGCVWLIERAVGALPGVASVQVNATAQRARVTWRDAATTLPRILERLALSGYRAFPLDAQTLDDVRRRESRDALKRLLVAGFAAMQAMMYAAVLYLGDLDSPDPSTNELFRWLGFLAATPVVFYSARPFFAGARRSHQAPPLGLDVPIAFAIPHINASSIN